MKRAASLIPTLKLAAQDDPEARARAAWEPAAGKKIARHTCAVALVRGTLTVEVEDMVWQRQLTPLIPALVRNLTSILGEPLVTGIAFRRMPPRIAPRRATAARPADESTGIADPVLKLLYRQSLPEQVKKKESA